MKLVCDIEVALPDKRAYSKNTIVNQSKYAMREVWKDVVGFELTHKVSNLGNIIVKDRLIERTRTHGGSVVHQKYVRKGHVLKPSTTVEGYLQITLGREKKTTHKVHRWVAQAFIPNPENKPQVNHIDGVKDNNHVDNLEWCTSHENVIHSYALGLACNKGQRHPKSKLKDVDIINIRELYKGGTSIKVIAGMYNLHRSTIEKVVRRIHWGHI